MSTARLTGFLGRARGRRSASMGSSLALAASVVLLGVAPAQAIPIVEVSGSGQPTGFSIGTLYGGEQMLAVSWTTTDSYSDVVITAWLSGTFRGHAYLTTAAGPGTTLASQIAVSDINLDIADSVPEDVQLFDGLMLSPATYFLLLQATGGGHGNWWRAQVQTIVLDAGVSLNDSLGANDAGIDAAFAPASSFVVVGNGLPLSYTVRGERSAAVPEPISGLMMGGGLAALAWARRRGGRSWWNRR
jgi:hypothetical protein